MPWDVFGLAVDILQTEHLSKLENFCLDAEKRSLLHTVCLESLNLQDSEHIGMSFTLLLSLGKKLNWNLNPNFRDKHGKRPVDYCKPGSQMHGFVKLVTVECKEMSFCSFNNLYYRKMWRTFFPFFFLSFFISHSHLIKDIWLFDLEIGLNTVSVKCNIETVKKVSLNTFPLFTIVLNKYPSVNSEQAF